MSPEPTKDAARKRLSDLLQEQQEPFRLEVYLHERGYKRKSLSKKSSTVKMCSRIVRDVCRRLVCINEGVKLKGFESCGRLSTEVESFHDDGEERMMEWRVVEEGKQCSPVSVLDEIEMISNETSSGQEIEEEDISSLSFRFPNMKKVTEECIHRETNTVIREKIKSWKKDSVNGKKMNKLVRLEILSSYQEKENLEGFREEIVKKIGDEILEEIVNSDIFLII